MRRQELVSHGRDNARTDRTRSEWDEVYEFVDDSFHEAIPVSPCQKGSPPIVPLESPIFDPSLTKSVYLETVRSFLKPRLFQTWGRIQQNEEREYEKIVARVLMLIHHHDSKKDDGTTLEEFDGVLDKFVGDVAHVTLTAKDGEVLLGEYPATELRRKGIRENRRFKCRTVELGTSVEFRIESVPDYELSAEREQQIRDLIQKSLGDDNGPQDDY